MDAHSASGHRLYYYDQRGGGRSPHEPADIAQHLADLDHIRQQLGEQHLLLCGYSWGALLALLYATRYGRVEKMALVSPAPIFSAGRPVMLERLAEKLKRPEVTALRRELDLSDKRNRFALAVSGYFVNPQRALELTPFTVRERAADAIWQSLGDYDLRPQLSGLAVKMLVVAGQEDPIPIANASELSQLAGAELVEIPRCGHVPYIEAPDALFPALIRFFATYD
jgi:proline iminopeptidase